MRTRIVLFLLLCMPMLLNAQGKLTAYYANEDFDDYKKGQLIVDTNDPLNRIVNYNNTKYKYEGDDSGEYYSKLMLKSQVTVKEYQMSPLPVELVKDNATFVSQDGHTVRIFAARAAGYSFYSYINEDGEFDLILDVAQTEAHQQYYALSGVFRSPYSDDDYLFEDPLEVEDGNIKLYDDSPYASNNPSSVRYRPYKLGYLEERWTIPEEYGYDKSAYDDNGNLLVDAISMVDIPTYLSIAYIAKEDALYINGTLYYRQK